MSRLGAVNSVHMQPETAVQKLKMTACAKKRLSEDETPTEYVGSATAQQQDQYTKMRMCPPSEHNRLG